MLDPFTALSLASGVVQLVEFGANLIEKSYEIYRSTSGSSDEVVKLEQMITQFRALTYNLHTATKASPFDQASQDEQNTITLAMSSQHVADDFLALLKDLKIQASPGKIESVKLAYRIGKKKKQLDNYRKELESLRAALNTQLLSTICRCHASAVGRSVVK